MSTVAIVYFSGYGHTQKQAEAVAQGARDAGAQVFEHRIDADGNLPEERLVLARRGRRHHLRLADIHGRTGVAV